MLDDELLHLQELRRGTLRREKQPDELHKSQPCGSKFNQTGSRRILKLVQERHQRGVALLDEQHALRKQQWHHSDLEDTVVVLVGFGRQCKHRRLAPKLPWSAICSVDSRLKPALVLLVEEEPQLLGAEDLAVAYLRATWLFRFLHTFVLVDPRKHGRRVIPQYWSGGGAAPRKAGSGGADRSPTQEIDGVGGGDGGGVGGGSAAGAPSQRLRRSPVSLALSASGPAQAGKLPSAVAPRDEASEVRCERRLETKRLRFEVLAGAGTAPSATVGGPRGGGSSEASKRPDLRLLACALISLSHACCSSVDEHLREKRRYMTARASSASKDSAGSKPGTELTQLSAVHQTRRDPNSAGSTRARPQGCLIAATSSPQPQCPVRPIGTMRCTLR
eukprot:4178959-Prymnesium_polylepis.3